MKTIGIDVGGTKINIVLFDGKIVRSTTVGTPKNKKDFLALLKKLISEYYTPDTKGIGIGLPGLIDEKGKIITLPNLKFLNGFSMAAFLRQFSKKVSVHNDVNCILRAEMAFGAAMDAKNVVLLGLGTGIGSGIVINGKMYFGKGNAGEIGHIILDKMKTFENLAGGKTMKRYNDSEFKRIGFYIGLGCANVINILDPEKVVLAGGVVEKKGGKIIINEAIKTAQNHVVNKKSLKNRIVRGKVKMFAGAIGAAISVA